MNSDRQLSATGGRGFTLIEVLVALAIVIIAFMAMYGAMMQVIAATTLAQEKTLATWIALDRVTELRIAETFPDDDESSGEIEMAGAEWNYSIRVIETGSENIKQVIVEVAHSLEPDNVLGRATGALVNPQLTASGGVVTGPPPGECPPGEVCE
jgi:general secretion pathway protein I